MRKTMADKKTKKIKSKVKKVTKKNPPKTKNTKISGKKRLKLQQKTKQQESIERLISKGKDQGYLTFADVNDHLPDIVDPNQIEDILGMLSDDIGIPIHDKAPPPHVTPPPAVEIVEEETLEHTVMLTPKIT